MSNLFLTVLSLSLMGSAIILCVILLDKMVRKSYSRQWIYLMWAVIALRLMIPINISLFHLPEMNKAEKVAMVNSIDGMDTDETADTIKNLQGSVLENHFDREQSKNLEPIREDSDSSTSLGTIYETKELKENNITNKLSFLYSALDILAAIWIAGVLLFLSYHFGAYLSYRKKILRWSIQVKNNEVLDQQYRELCEEMDLKASINIIASNQVQSPMLLGFFRPYIVLPTREFSKEQYYFILKHELIHYQRRDLFYKLIMLCAAAIHWFNPLVHYMVYLANHDMELYCDEKLVDKHDLSYREKYSNMLLQIIVASNQKQNLLLSTGFGNQKSKLKNRFFQIMNAVPTKKGRGLIIGLVGLIVVIGSITAGFLPKETSHAKIKDQQMELATATADVKDYDSERLEEVSNILVVGIDGVDSNEYLRADSILVVSVNPNGNKISIISFLRDMYLQIPGHDKDKLSSVYMLGGANLMKSTIETNFDISIDHTVTIDMGAFEEIVNSIGGVEIELSEKEAQYLNTTNYISNKQYRNVKAGKQILNGNQALGYVRIRQIPTIEGESGDLGRTARLRSLLSFMLKECSKKDIIELTEVLTKVIPRVTTDLSPRQALIYVNTVLGRDLSTDTRLIPAADSYTEKVVDNRAVIDVDLDKCRESLKQLYQ